MKQTFVKMYDEYSLIKFLIALPFMVAIIRLLNSVIDESGVDSE